MDRGSSARMLLNNLNAEVAKKPDELIEENFISILKRNWNNCTLIYLKIYPSVAILKYGLVE